jgi:hypothetical protein
VIKKSDLAELVTFHDGAPVRAIVVKGQTASIDDENISAG